MYFVYYDTNIFNEINDVPVYIYKTVIIKNAFKYMKSNAIKLKHVAKLIQVRMNIHDYKTQQVQNFHIKHLQIEIILIIIQLN